MKAIFFASEAIRWSVIKVLNLSIYSNPMILPLCYWHNYLVVGLRVIQFTRRNHSAESNALLVEFIERLGSVKFGNRTQSKSPPKILAIEPSRTLIEFDTVRWSKLTIRLKVGRYTGKLRVLCWMFPFPSSSLLSYEGKSFSFSSTLKHKTQRNPIKAGRVRTTCPTVF